MNNNVEYIYKIEKEREKGGKVLSVIAIVVIIIVIVVIIIIVCGIFGWLLVIVDIF